MKIVRRREPLRLIILSETIGSGQQSDGVGVLTRLIWSKLDSSPGIDDGVLGFCEHWKSVACLSISGCSLSVFLVELTCLPLLERLYLDSNKLTQLPPSLVNCELRKYQRLTTTCRHLYLTITFGNPLEFLPDTLPLHKLHHLSLANIRIEELTV